MSRTMKNKQNADLISLREAGEILVRAAEERFPATTTRCVQCGFRRQYHEPSNHNYKAPQNPFVEALRRFVDVVCENNSSTARREND